ncbi:MAG: hypothetical protein KAJ16_03265 [Calditrichia bacterium]|nr:hypothetical protein [Calditrichia bacterium]
MNLNIDLLTGIILLLFMIILLWQMLYLMRLKNILSNFYQYTESIFKFFLRSSKSTRVDSKDLIPKTCQFCKFRLSFIQMGEEKSDPEDFYYKCQLKNIPITLEDSCESFEIDKNTF